MTPEQKELFDKLTRLQQNVATNFIAGMEPSEAHRVAGGKCKNESNRRKLASEILTNQDVKAFIDSMKEEAVNEAVMSRQEMMERLSNLSRVNMSDLIEWHVSESVDDDGNRAEQSTWSIKESAKQDEVAMSSIAEVTAGRDGFKIKQHSPLTAMKQLADLAGYNQPQKIEQSGTVTNVQMSKEDYEEVRKKMLEEDDC